MSPSDSLLPSGASHLSPLQAACCLPPHQAGPSDLGLSIHNPDLIHPPARPLFHHLRVDLLRCLQVAEPTSRSWKTKERERER